MAFEPFASKLIPFMLTLIFLSLTLLLLHKKIHTKNIESWSPQNTRWYDVLKKEIQGGKIKIGFVNMEVGLHRNDQLHGSSVEPVKVRFDRVDMDRQWSDFFPKTIDEDEIGGPPLCPKMPMPKFEYYRGLDVVVARVPCQKGAQREGIRDLFRLQLNLVVANLLVKSQWENHDDQLDRMVYAVFIGSCGPMREIFRCEDLVMHEDGIWVYRPNLRKLKQKVNMPAGTCQVAPPYKDPGEEDWSKYQFPVTNDTLFRSREAYVTVLHSSESFVCGAIALAQSLIQSHTTKDLVLLADSSISETSIRGLREAGWKIKHIKRIRSPSSKRKAYSEWNYSKLRVWQLTEYDKVLFIDSDLIVLKNIDHFFSYPQLSAVGEDFIFNSGVMLVEPSECTFRTLMEKMDNVASYDATDQGFLNEMFIWWHRWPKELNRITLFHDEEEGEEEKHEMLGDPYAIHYLGIKPWMCQTEHDCNWDIPHLDQFASNYSHRRWLQVYNALPERLQGYCEKTVLEDPTIERIRKWKESYKDDDDDVHWTTNCFLISFLMSLFICFSLFVRHWEKLNSALVHVSSLACSWFDKKYIKTY